MFILTVLDKSRTDGTNLDELDHGMPALARHAPRPVQYEDEVDLWRGFVSLIEPLHQVPTLLESVFRRLCSYSVCKWRYSVSARQRLERRGRHHRRCLRQPPVASLRPRFRGIIRQERGVFGEFPLWRVVSRSNHHQQQQQPQQNQHIRCHVWVSSNLCFLRYHYHFYTNGHVFFIVWVNSRGLHRFCTSVAAPILNFTSWCNVENSELSEFLFVLCWSE